MRNLATQPSNTNTVRVPGFDALQDGGGPFVREALAKFCPAAMSPSEVLEEEKVRGYILVFKKGYCGNIGRALGRNIQGPDACFKLAQEEGATGFSMGRKYRKGKCCVELQPFTCENYAQWLADPAKPTCPSSSSGRFHNSRYYNWFALEPNCAE